MPRHRSRDTLEERLIKAGETASAARDGKMGRPGALLDRQPVGEGGFVDPLV